jgi:hypothetical protein
MSGKMHGGIRIDNLKPPGLPAAALNAIAIYPLQNPAVAASNNAATFQGSNLLTATSIGSTTSASGTQPDVPRNLRYEINISGDATGMVSAGTLNVAGLDISGRSMTETVALTHIASAGSASYVQGTKVFASLNASALTVSGYLLATASSTRSLSISMFLGWDNKVGLPQSIQSSNAVAALYLRSTNAISRVTGFTCHSGDIGQAAVEYGTLATNRDLVAYVFQNR